MNKVKGKLSPLRDKIIVTEMEFGLEQTGAGLFVVSDDGKRSGIHPRWAKVYAVGPDQKDVNIGDWVLLEHGRWSRGMDYINEFDEEIVIRQADKDAILLVSNEKPDSIMRSVSAEAGSNFNFNIPGA